MTLAETASIMNETILNHASLKKAKNDSERLAILESKLNGDSAGLVGYLFTIFI